MSDDLLRSQTGTEVHALEALLNINEALATADPENMSENELKLHAENIALRVALDASCSQGTEQLRDERGRIGGLLDAILHARSALRG